MSDSPLFPSPSSKNDVAQFKKIAVIASSGGGTATLGHTDPSSLLHMIHNHLLLTDCCVAEAIFVSLDGGKGMDGCNADIDSATLYQVNSSESSKVDVTFQCAVQQTGTLKHINTYIQEQGLDETLASRIDKSDIHGLICISCHTGLFQKTLQSASRMKIPVTGSGGTSLSQAVALYGLNLQGNAGGSVATTSYTRAVSYTAALASYWKRNYEPWKQQNNNKNVPSWTSILNSCLPAFWGVCLCKQVVRTVQVWLPFFIARTTTRLSWNDESVQENASNALNTFIYVLEYHVLPVSCAVIMATSTNTPNDGGNVNQTATTAALDLPQSSLLLSSILAASMVAQQSVLSGLLVGWFVRKWSVRILFACIVRNVPATMTNLLSTTLTGFLVSVALAPIAPRLRRISSATRLAILSTVSLSDVRLRVVGAMTWGCISCYGSKIGWYHAWHLPAILMVEMELGDPSFLGAIDELTLVLVCAGICAGNLIVQQIEKQRNCIKQDDSHLVVTDADAAISRRGLVVNLACGDFIEVCYPYMEKYPIINWSGYLASALSSAVLVLSSNNPNQVPKSLAYVPWPVAIWLSREFWLQMIVASVVAATIPCLATILNGIYSKSYKTKDN